MAKKRALIRDKHVEAKITKQEFEPLQRVHFFNTNANAEKTQKVIAEQQELCEIDDNDVLNLIEGIAVRKMDDEHSRERLEEQNRVSVMQ